MDRYKLNKMSNKEEEDKSDDLKANTNVEDSKDQQPESPVQQVEEKKDQIVP